MAAPPSGMVTFLLTDIEGSSRLWETHPEGMGRALAEHDRVLREAIDSHHGYLFATAGDSIGAAFHEAADAVNAALAAQLATKELAVGGRSGCGTWSDRNGYSNWPVPPFRLASQPCGR
jgi:class 3 adenylate cyclase